MKILGVKIDSVTYQEALEKAKKLLDSEGKHYIVTPNPEIVVQAQKDPEFKKILIGGHFFGRLFTEFLSLNWFIQSIIDRMKSIESNY